MLPYTLHYIFFTAANAQITKIDSLKRIIRETAAPAEKINAIFMLCKEYEYLHADTLYAYTQQAKLLAVQKKDPKKILEAEYFEAVYLFKKINWTVHYC